MEEIWKDIPGHPGYQASNLGRIKSLNYNKTGRPKLLSVNKFSTGYLRVAIQCDKKSKSFAVHRLVALSFVPNPYGKPQVNHIDGDRTNNIATNLEWVTSRENINHMHRVLKNRPYFLKSGRGLGWQRKAVRCVETGEIFPSISSAAKSIGVCDRAISQLLKKPANRHTAGGFHWELA